MLPKKVFILNYLVRKHWKFSKTSGLFLFVLAFLVSLQCLKKEDLYC